MSPSPYAAAELDVTDPRRTSGIAPRHRVIVADDSADARQLLTTVLEANGFAVTQAHDGQELYDLITSAEVGYFRVVVADQVMPRLFGTEVLARAGSRVQFVIVSGAVTAELRAAAERYGVAAVLSKPLDIPRFLDVVLDLAEATPPGAPSRPRTARG